MHSRFTSSLSHSAENSLASCFTVRKLPTWSLNNSVLIWSSRNLWIFFNFCSLFMGFWSSVAQNMPLNIRYSESCSHIFFFHTCSSIHKPKFNLALQSNGNCVIYKIVGRSTVQPTRPLTFVISRTPCTCWVGKVKWDPSNKSFHFMNTGTRTWNIPFDSLSMHSPE